MTKNKTMYLYALVLFLVSHFMCLPCSADNLLNNILDEVKEADRKGNTDSAASYLFTIVQTAEKSDLNNFDNRKVLTESTTLAVDIAKKLEGSYDLAFVESLCRNELVAFDLLHGRENDKAFWQAKLAHIYAKQKDHEEARQAYANLFRMPANQKLNKSSFYLRARHEYPDLLRNMGRSQDADLFEKTHPQ